LIEQAERVAEREEEERKKVEKSKGIEAIDKKTIDKVEGKTETEEEEQNQPEQPKPVTPTLSRIQKAYLAFCITLLNQSITHREYNNPLVCTLAVLSVKKNR
jgi:hypothetical protein